MVANNKQKIDLNWSKMHLIERFDTVLYPLDVGEMLRQLPKLGYVVAERILYGARLEEGMPLAIKGDVEIRLNQDNKTIGIMGYNADKILEEFKILRDWWTQQLDPSPNMRTDYVEFDCAGWAKTQQSPLQTFNDWWKGTSKIDRFKKVLQNDVTTFGLSLCPPQTDPNNPRWFHITIDPLIPAANSRYNIRVIWREEDLEAVLNKFKNIDSIVKNIIAEIERE